MIVLIHNQNKVLSISKRSTAETFDIIKGNSIINVLYDTAKKFPNEILVWCHLQHETNINYKAIEASIVLKNEMCSFSNRQYLPDAIGYIEQSPFINVNKNVKYPTWLMSSDIGAIHAIQLLKFKTIVNDNDFDYALNSIAKLGMPRGLFCYSEPNLLIEVKDVDIQASKSTLFKFVKQHYKFQWVFILILNYLWHEKRLVFLALIKSLVYKRKFFNEHIVPVPLINRNIKDTTSIDVIIPTIGRKKFLYNVLSDFKKQTVLPNRVIIVEQNPESNSTSDLDYLINEDWPFIVDHLFTHNIGACQARNLALRKVNSAYVFFADDDCVFESLFFEKIMNSLENFEFDVMNFSCLQKGEVEKRKDIFQWSAFGSGCSIVNSQLLKNVKFNTAFEFGYGEDVDFGMQLRNLGADIMYMPNIQMIHLKAPTGGFRTPFVQEWGNDLIQPKPSPTVMLYHLKNTTIQQLLGYKLLLFIKFYKKQTIKNPFRYYKSMNQRWAVSKIWANKLENI